MSFISKAKKQAKEFGGIPFWSWNDKLDKDELIRQINHMHELDFNGFFMHARGGLMTEYCSDEWYDCIQACVDEAKKLNMEAWAYDENGWPSGFAGGKLLEDEKNHVPFLTAKEDLFDESAFAVYDLDTNALIEKKDADKSKKYLNVYRTYSSSYVDVMDESIVKKFIDSTHEEYKSRIAELGSTMPGFFTDEPQYYRYNTAWSDTFLTLFEETYGYSVFKAIPALFTDFEGAKELRYDYWLLCHKQYTNSFAKQIYDWCNNNSVKLTGHTIEESNLAWQMLCCGGVMPFYEYQHMPGIDHLARQVNTDLSPKQVGSVAAQLGKKKVLSETFACCGWDVSPIELKRMAQWQVACGINVICMHLYPYSERGERKYDFPAHYSEHLPWSPFIKTFNNYFANIGSTLAQGKENANVLVLHPIHSAYLYFQRDNWDKCIRHLDESLYALIEKYGDNNIQYHLGDELIIQKHGKIKNDKFIVGKCAYDYVVLPSCETIDLSTAKLLKRFIANGGKVVIEGNAPTRIDGKIKDLSWLKPTADFNSLLDAREAFVTCNGEILNRVRLNIRSTKESRMFYLTNLSKNEYKNVVLTIKDCNGIKELNMFDMKSNATDFVLNNDTLTLSVDLADSEAYFFYEDKNAVAATKKEISNASFNLATDGFTLVKTPENCLVLDFAQISYDGINYEPVRYIKHIHELLLKRRNNTTIYLKYKFNATYVPKNLSLCIEPLDSLEIFVNGIEVKQTDEWRIDRSFKLAPISNAVKSGANEVVLKFNYYQSPDVYKVLFNEVMESLRNCLTLDSEIEAIYLFGDFGVKNKKAFTAGKNGSKLNNGSFAIGKPRCKVNVSDLVEESFPFYSGSIAFRKSFEANEGIYRLKLDGNFAVANVYVNNKKAGTVMFSRTIDVKLKQGKNSIRIEIFNSLRNTFGPLHHIEDEIYGLTPNHFTLEGSWSEEKTSPNYAMRYSFMPFGVSNLTFTEIK